MKATEEETESIIQILTKTIKQESSERNNNKCYPPEPPARKKEKSCLPSGKWLSLKISLINAGSHAAEATISRWCVPDATGSRNWVSLVGNIKVT